MIEPPAGKVNYLDARKANGREAARNIHPPSRRRTRRARPAPGTAAAAATAAPVAAAATQQPTAAPQATTTTQARPRPPRRRRPRRRPDADPGARDDDRARHHDAGPADPDGAHPDRTAHADHPRPDPDRTRRDRHARGRHRRHRAGGSVVDGAARAPHRPALRRFLVLLARRAAPAPSGSAASGPASLANAATTQQVSSAKLPARRGTIVDRKGSRARGLRARRRRLRHAVPRQGPGRGRGAARARSSARRPRTLVQKLARTRHRLRLPRARASPPTRRDKIAEARSSPGIDARRPASAAPTRASWLASQVLGTVGTDGKGLSGLEYERNKILRGHATASGGSSRTRSASRSTSATRKPAKPGATPRADASTPRSRTRSSSVLAGRRRRPTSPRARPRSSWTRATARSSRWPTGRASTPTTPAPRPPTPRQNRAVGLTYEPGSTFKAFTVAGALEDGVVTPDTTFDLAAADPGRRPRRSASRTRAGGDADAPREILAQSEQRRRDHDRPEAEGKQRFDKWVRRFGFGQPTGVDLPGEERGHRPAAGQVLGLLDGQPADRPGHRGHADADGAGLRARSPTAGSCARRTIVAPDRRRRASPRRRAGASSRRSTAAQLRDDARGRARARAARPSEVSIPGYELAGKTGTANKIDPKTGEYSEAALRRVVRRLRAGAAPAAADRRDGRRAARRDLRRHGRGAGVRADRALRAAVPADPAGVRRVARPAP